MNSQNFVVGVFNDALRKDLKPHAIPDDSYPILTNMYQWRGRVKRRSGYRKLGTLANGTPVMGLKTKEGFSPGLQELVAFDTTDAYLWNGTAFVALPSTMTTVWSGTDSQFFWTTNYANAFWATNSKSGLHGWNVQAFTNQAGTGNSATVQVTSAGNNVQVGDYVYFINLSTTALQNNAAVLAQVTVAGDPFTVQAVDQPSGSTFAWVNGVTSTGMVLDSMQSISGQDGIRYYGILTNGTGWANYNPPISQTVALAGALMIFAYRGYLVFLNTTEGNDQGTFNFGNRARWTQIGTPYYSYPVPNSPNLQTVDVRTARDDLFGRGGANDAPTNEVIVAAGFIQDILIVYFERSTWRLRFVNNSQNPFVWERLNVELGSQCTFSTIIFDKGLMAIGNRGIVTSDGNNTKRFDEKIPDTIFEIRQANDGFRRVQGIRTFESKLNYWTYPSIENPSGIYPDKVLVFNYDTGNWSFFDDCFTCFGYYYPTSGQKYTWGDLTNAWSSYTDISWNSSGLQTGDENIIAGNQQGYVFILETGGAQNDPSLSISAITVANPGVFTSTNNNLPDGTWITLSGITGTTSADGVSLNGRNFKVVNPTLAANTFTLQEFQPLSAGNASGTTFTYTISWKNILKGSPQINVGSIVFLDPDGSGELTGTGGVGGSGTINYLTGAVSLTFDSAIGSTPVYIRVVSLDPNQGLINVETTGVYAGGGEIAKISGIDIQSKYFNFFGNDKRARLSKIDFYVNSTEVGQFTCNVFGDSDNIPINRPLSDNPFSNVVLTSTSPYQIGKGDQTIYRLYCDAIAQTIQVQLTLSDAQLAVNAISQSDIELGALVFSMRQGGRLV